MLNDLSAAFGAVTVAKRDSLSAINLWGGLAISRLPQLMAFDGRAGAPPGGRVYAAMFGNGNGATWFSAPASPTTQSTLTLGPGGFVSRSIKALVDATPYEADLVLPIGGSLIYPVEDFSDVVPTMMSALRAQGTLRDQANRSLAAAANFPSTTIEMQAAETGAWATVDSTIVIRDSSATLRAQCSNCTNALPQGGSATQQSLAVGTGSSGYTFVGLSFDPVPSGALNALGIGEVAGAIMSRFDPAAALSSLSVAYRAAVPIRVPMSLRLFRLETDSQRVAPDSVVTMRAIVLPPSGGYTIDWDFGDSTPVVRTSNTPQVTHRYAEPGVRGVRAVLRGMANTPVPTLLLATTRGKVVVNEPLTITPNPLTGFYDRDYTLTANSNTPAPANASWIWELGDGRTVTTQSNQLIVRYPTPSPVVGKTFALKVTLKSGANTISTGIGAAEIEAGIDAWKFNAVTATFTSPRPQGSGYDVRWRVDSAIFARIGAGVSQGGIRFVGQAFSPPGFPSRTAPVGLYLLEGALINLANLDHPLTTNNFITTTFPDAVLPLPAAPQVSGWNLIQLAAPMNPTCLANENSYTFTGTIVDGHLTGRRVPLCVQSFILPQINGARLMSMEADVNFGATTATGTITVVYYFYGNGAPANTFQRTARLNFSATRLTP